MRRRTAVVLGLALGAAVAVIAAVAVGGGGSSETASLPGELKVVDVEGMPVRSPEIRSLARAGTNAVLVGARSAALVAAAKRSQLVVLTPLTTASGNAPASACRRVHGLCTIEVSSSADALRAAAAEGVDLVVVRVSEPGQLRALTTKAHRGRILAVLSGSGTRAWVDAVRAAAASAFVDIAVPPSLLALVRVSAPLAVSMIGSDSNNCSQTSPCLTLDRAYHVAAPGQVVEVAGGTYPGQTLLYDSRKAGAKRAHVIFQPAVGATVTITGDLSLSDARTVKGASHVTFRRMTILQNVDLEGCGVPDGAQCPPAASAGTSDLTFDHLRVKGPVSFLCHSCDHVKILGGVWGPDTYRPCHGSLHPEVSPTYDATSFVKLKRPNHILIDGARFQNFARCSSSDHSECLQFEPADYVTITNSVFTHCDTITLAFFTSLAGDSRSPAGFAAPDHIVLENNFIDHSYNLPGGPTYNALQIGECTNCVIRYNSWLQNTHLPCNTPCGEISRNNIVVGNVGPQSECGNGGIKFSHNVFQGIACGPTDKNVRSLGFVSPRTLNLHLRASSPAVNAGDPRDFPRHDIDRQRRPIGPRPDAGADEYSGRR